MSLPFSTDALMSAVATGRVTRRKHPTLPLYIYNYSPTCQYDNDWDEVTLNCRGLILDEDYNIVARPWKKFFNLGQVNLPMQFDDPVEVMDKADGSLGIMYSAPDGYAIATRGSFESEQAIKGTQILNDKWDEYRPHKTPIVRGYTYLFEIVYPQNRIVLDYGDREDLILLGCVQTETGYYYSPGVAAAYLDWAGPVVERMPFKTISDALGHMDRSNAEGYVIRSHNFMVKLKQPDYLDLHRLVTNASPKTVWEQLKEGKSKSEIVSVFPDEFHDYIGSMVEPLLKAYDERVDEITKVFFHAKSSAEMRAANSGLDSSCSRKDYASEFKKYKDAKYFFVLLDGRSIRDALWTELRPRADER